MRGASRSMWYHIGVIGTALALSLGSMVLAGCGSSGEAPADAEATDAATTESAESAEQSEPEQAEDASSEEAEEDQTQHWFQTLSKRHVQGVQQSWINPGETCQSITEQSTSYELDEHGNVTKAVTTMAYTGEGYEDRTEEVREYTINEKGWPQSIEITRTTATHSVDYEMVEDYDEDGNLVGSMQAIDDGETIDTVEPEVETSTATFTYEYDDEGRVVKATTDDASFGNIELTYQGDGKIATFKHSHTYDMQNAQGDPVATTYDYEFRYNEKGKVIGAVDTTSDEDGTSETVSEYDENGNVLKETTTITDSDGSKHELVMTYDLEKDDKGNVVKSTCTVSGDGEGSRVRNVGYSSRISETFGSDGSITAAETTYDEDYNEVEGESQTYDGPYSVTERTFDGDGNVLTEKVDYYDGTSARHEYTYDKDGNITKSVDEEPNGFVTTVTNTYDSEGNQLSSKIEESGEGAQQSEITYEWAHVEEPSEYAGTFYQHTWW